MGKQGPRANCRSWRNAEGDVPAHVFGRPQSAAHDLTRHVLNRGVRASPGTSSEAGSTSSHLLRALAEWRIRLVVPRHLAGAEERFQSTCWNELATSLPSEILGRIAVVFRTPSGAWRSRGRLAGRPVPASHRAVLGASFSRALSAPKNLGRWPSGVPGVTPAERGPEAWHWAGGKLCAAASILPSLPLGYTV